MEVIVQRALTKIAQDCPRKHNALKKACRETLGESQADGQIEHNQRTSSKHLTVLSFVLSKTCQPGLLYDYPSLD